MWCLSEPSSRFSTWCLSVPSSGFSMWCLSVPSSWFWICYVFLCHHLDFPCDILVCHILRSLLRWYAAVTKAIQFSIWAVVTGPFGSFVLLKGKRAPEIAKLPWTLHCDTECIPSCRQNETFCPVWKQEQKAACSSLLNRVSSCSTSCGARAASRACHHKRNRILSRWVGRQSKKQSTRIRSAVTAFNVHCSLEIAPAATAESGGDGGPGPAAPATDDGAVNAWINTLPCKVANSCACQCATVHTIWTPWTPLQIQSNEHHIRCRMRCCMRCCMQERTICRSKHTMSYTMRTYDVVCQTYGGQARFSHLFQLFFLHFFWFRV